MQFRIRSFELPPIAATFVLSVIIGTMAFADERKTATEHESEEHGKYYV